MLLRKMIPVLLSIAAALMLAGTAAEAQEVIRYVDGSVSASGNGEYWETAYKYLQEALADSAATQIWVAQGMYRPDESMEYPDGTGNRGVWFQMVNGVDVYGGFAGGETQVSQRDYETNVTILSGDLNGDDGPNFTNYGDNSYRVVFVWSGVYSGLLDGFTIAGGSSEGMQCGYSTFTVRNCTVASNTTGNNTSGAGVGLGSGGTYTFDNCVFSNNVGGSDSSGGGMYIADATVTLTDCEFLGNYAENGGAIFSTGTSGKELVIERCLFSGNSASYGGGTYFRSRAELVDCIFVGNYADDHGGGIYHYWNVMTVTNCVFSCNTADKYGGAVATGSGSPGLTNCTFTANSAVVGNGGGVCTVAGDSTPVLTNCIFWNNSDAGGTDETAQIDHMSDSCPLPTVNYCLVQGLNVYAGPEYYGNIDGDPLFEGADDLRLTSGSPAIDAGDSDAVPPDTLDVDGDGDFDEPLPFDLDGNPRIVGDAVDMGAYEFQGGCQVDAVMYDGDTLLSTEGADTVAASLVATLYCGPEVADVDDESVTFTLTAEGIVGEIVVTASSVDGVATAVAAALEPAIYTVDIDAGDISGSGILVVYNPEGGFATGGGWIVPADDGENTHPDVRANFGFVAKYKGVDPAGNINFRYSDGFLHLNSTSIEQVVITGGRIVQFKGWASVNGEDDYWFFAKGIDNADPGELVDSFEIRVWVPGADPDIVEPVDRAGGILQGGNIVVHTR